MGKLFVFRPIKLKFCFWLYKNCSYSFIVTHGKIHLLAKILLIDKIPLMSQCKEMFCSCLLKTYGVCQTVWI